MSGFVRYFDVLDRDRLAPAENSRIETLFHVHLGACLYRREVFERIGTFSETLMYSEDVDLLLRVREAEIDFTILRGIMLYYRRHADSMMAQKSAQDRRFPPRGRNVAGANDAPVVSRQSISTCSKPSSRRFLSQPISVVCPAWQAAATFGRDRGKRAGADRTAKRNHCCRRRIDGRHGRSGKAAGAVVISRPHSGVAAALNAGIAASRGELLAFIDADDLWPADKLAAQTALLALDPALAGVLGLVRSFFSPDIEASARAQLRLPDDLQQAWLTGALLVRRAALQAVGLFDEAMQAGHAIDWFDRARHLGLTFAMPKQIVLLRRVRSNSLSGRWGPSRRRLRADGLEGGPTPPGFRESE